MTEKQRAKKTANRSLLLAKINSIIESDPSFPHTVRTEFNDSTGKPFLDLLEIKRNVDNQITSALKGDELAIGHLVLIATWAAGALMQINEVHPKAVRALARDTPTWPVLAGSGQHISVTTVCPGLMRTGSHWNARFKGQREKEFAWFAHGASLPGISMSVSRAAQQIVDAMSRRQAELIISVQANAAVIADAVTPGFVALASSLVCRFLPGTPVQGGRRSRSGWHARSQWVPSILTRLGDKAAEDNNEVGDKKPPIE